MNQNIFLSLIYDKDYIDVTGTKYEEIFKKADYDPHFITFGNLLWCATEIANTLPTSDGAKFLEDTINIASYLVNRKQKGDI